MQSYVFHLIKQCCLLKRDIRKCSSNKVLHGISGKRINAMRIGRQNGGVVGLKWTDLNIGDGKGQNTRKLWTFEDGPAPAAFTFCYISLVYDHVHSTFIHTGRRSHYFTHLFTCTTRLKTDDATSHWHTCQFYTSIYQWLLVCMFYVKSTSYVVAACYWQNYVQSECTCAHELKLLTILSDCDVFVQAGKKLKTI